MTVNEEPVGVESNTGAMGGALGVAPMGESQMPSVNPMPMPGQEMTPPPVTPMPDFGAMPPEMPMVGGAMPGVGATMPVENTIPVPEPVAVPEVAVQPDMNAGVVAAGLPQVPEAPVAPETPADPSAFKIPGIHT